MSELAAGCVQIRQQGSPAYMAPELYGAEPLYSSAADIWALGCLLYECAAGHAPFLSASFQELSAAVLEAEPSPIPGKCCSITAILLARDWASVCIVIVCKMQPLSVHLGAHKLTT